MNSSIQTERNEPFVELIERLFNELDLAIRWNRPSILLAIYASEYVRADAETALSAMLNSLGHTVVSYRVTGENNADVPLHLLKYPDKDRIVFFVSGLQWGGGIDGQNAYRALNFRREYFVDGLIRVVFWLTEKEAIALPNYAPDFWAFRHRVVEFIVPFDLVQMTHATQQMVWKDLEYRELRVDTEAKIALREALLIDLPESNETITTRIDLLYTLAALYRVKALYEKSLELLDSALKLAQKLGNTSLQARCYNAVGNVYYYLRRYDEAIHCYHRAIASDSQFINPRSRLGNVYRAQGRLDDAFQAYQDAIDRNAIEPYPHKGLANVYADWGQYEYAIYKYKRAIELDPQWGTPHHGLAKVYAIIRRNEEALAEFLVAVDLDPKWAAPHISLAGIYYKLNRIVEYREKIKIAHDLMDFSDDYRHACFESVSGNVNDAIYFLNLALQKKQVSLLWAKRNPDFDFIREDQRFKAIINKIQ